MRWWGPSAAMMWVVLSLSSAVVAQQAVSRGQVVDEQGAAISNATVTLTRSGAGESRGIKVNGKGEFVIPNNLPAGNYTLEVKSKGFETYTQDDLQIPMPLPLKVMMKVAAIKDVTEVSSETKGVSVDPDQNLSMTVLDEDFIKNNLPDNEEDMLAYLQALAGPAAGGISGGQGQAQIFIDGFSGGHLPPREAIFQIRINQNPYTAEYSAPGFGRIEIITKPGNDQWRGNVSFSARNSALDARNAFAKDKPDLSQERYGFNIGGPLIKKKLSFFSNFEQRRLDGSSTINATTLNGPVILNVSAPSRNKNLMLRGDYLINNRNTLNASYMYFDSESINREFSPRFGGFGPGGGGGGGGGGLGGGGGGFGGGGGGFGGGGGGGNGSNGIYMLPERGSNSENSNHTLRLSETFIINPSLLLESRLQLQHERTTLTANSSGIAINVQDAFLGGGSTCCPSNTRTVGGEWQEYMTLTKKKHTVKFGLQIIRDDVRDISATNFNGTYTFANLAQYMSVLNGDPDARPEQFTINRGDPLLRYQLTEYSSFVQDDWRIRPSLTLSFGLRHEFQSHLADKNNLAPRFGVAWSPFKDRKTVFRFGGGIFYSRLTGSLYGNTLRYDGLTQESIVIRSPIYDPTLSLIDLSFPPDTIKRVLDGNLKAPYTMMLSSTVERQLPKGLTGSATYIYSRGMHQFRTRNINAPLDGVRPLGDVGDIYQLESSASSKYNGLLFRVDRRFGQRFMIFSNYTLSWTMSDSDSPQSLPADNYNLASEWGRAYTDRRHSFFLGGRISLPKGLNLSPFIIASSGSPLNITTGFDENGDNNINDRPPGIARNTSIPASFYPQIPNSCFANCLPGGTPVLLRDYLMANYPYGVVAQSPGLFNVNMSISKTFSFGTRSGIAGPGMGPPGEMGGPPMGGPPMGGGGGRGGMGGRGGGAGRGETGRLNIQISTQFTNLLNHVNPGQYSGVLSSPYFLKPSSAGGARAMELVLRIGF